MTVEPEALLGTRETPLARWAPPLRWLSGLVFVAFGIGEGEVLPSLILAPALLAVMTFLLWAGPVAHALDGRLLARRPH